MERSCELFLCRDISLVCQTTIDLILILMIYVYNCKEFGSETTISYVGVVIHNKRGS